jgi:hypothetical protein
VRFLRHCALWLPAAFLLAALTFLGTHSSTDPALGIYPFLSDWLGAGRLPSGPRLRFLLQAGVLFVGPYLLWLALVALVAGAERSLFGKSARRPAGLFARIYGRAYLGLLLAAAFGIALAADTIRKRLTGGLQIDATLVAAAPFLAGAAALAPAALLAAPAAALWKMRQ